MLIGIAVEEDFKVFKISFISPFGDDSLVRASRFLFSLFFVSSVISC